MEKKSGILAYITALIPGVGYLYLGLRKKGLEALLLWLVIGPLFSMLGLGFLTGLIRLPFWFYTFFDTINMAVRIDRGEFIPDSDFLFLGRIIQSDTFTQGSNDGERENFKGIRFNNDGLIYLGGWALVVLGGLSLINKLFAGSPIYKMIRYNINIYLVPVLFVLAGVYLLVRNKKNM